MRKNTELQNSLAYTCWDSIYVDRLKRGEGLFLSISYVPGTVLGTLNL